MWDEWYCVVVWTFFGIAFLWDWNENDLFQSCGHCWVFQICWHNECSTFTASSLRIWNMVVTQAYLRTWGRTDLWGLAQKMSQERGMQCLWLMPRLGISIWRFSSYFPQWPQTKFVRNWEVTVKVRHNPSSYLERRLQRETHLKVESNPSLE